MSTVCSFELLLLTFSTEVNASQTFPDCVVCKTSVKEGFFLRNATDASGGVNAPGFGFMHKECFKCSDCNKPFGDAEPGGFEGKMICQDCYTVRREAMADPCCTCGKPITCGPKLAFHQKYHPGCVKYDSLCFHTELLGATSATKI